MSRKKNILIVVPSLTGGGAERVASAWADGLAARGHRVSVLTDLSRPATYMPAEDVRLLPLDLPSKPHGRGIGHAIWAVAARVRAISRLWNAMRRNPTDVVIDVGHFYAAEVLAVARLTGTKALQTDHNACTRPADMPLPIRDRLRKFVMSRLFDGVTVLTETDRKEMSRRGAGKAEVLHNPLTLSIYKADRRRDKVVLAVGRTEAWRVKGFDLLLDAWSRISPGHPEWRLRIVGGEPPGILNAQAERCHDTVEFCPFQAGIAEEYRNAEIFVMPSRCEGWGLAAVEAMSQGCAAIICDFEGRQREYIADGINGLVCAPDDVHGLENAIGRLICDEDLRRRLQLAAPDGLERFAPALVARRLEEIIYRVCGDREA